MVLSLVKKLAGMLAPASDGEPVQEVSLGACGLAEADWTVCRKLCVGEELALTARGEAVLVLSGGRPAGSLRGDEAKRARALLEKGAGVVCRVSSVKAGERTVRVRLLVRM